MSHMIHHFRDECLQAINCTGTDNQRLAVTTKQPRNDEQKKQPKDKLTGKNITCKNCSRFVSITVHDCGK